MFNIFKNHLGKWSFVIFIVMILAFFWSNLSQTPVEAKKSADMVIGDIKNIETLAKFGEFDNTASWDEMDQKLRKLEDAIKNSRVRSESIGDRNENFTLLRRSFQDYLDRSSKNLKDFVLDEFNLNRTLYVNISSINKNKQELTGLEYVNNDLKKWQELSSQLKIQSSLESRKIDKIQDLFEQSEAKNILLKMREQNSFIDKSLEDGIISEAEFGQNKKALETINLNPKNIKAKRYEELFANKEFYQAREFLLENIEAILKDVEE